MEHFTDFTSSNVARIGYESISYTLEIEFHNGSVYQYYNYPLFLWEAFKSSNSKGEFIHQNITENFKYICITPPA